MAPELANEAKARSSKAIDSEADYRGRDITSHRPCERGITKDLGSGAPLPAFIPVQFKGRQLCRSVGKGTGGLIVVRPFGEVQFGLSSAADSSPPYLYCSE